MIELADREINLYSTRSCDGCFFKHLSCDRVLPSCSRCIKFNLPCTQARKGSKCFSGLSKNNQSSPWTGSLSSTRENSVQLDPTNKVKVQNKSKRKLIVISYLPNQKNKKLNLTSIPIRIWVFLWPPCLQEWTSRTFVRIDFNYFIHLLGIQADQATKRDRLFLAKVFSELSPPKPALPVLSNLGTLSLDLINMATEAYFYYHNPFFPLFTKNSFMNEPRSCLLSLAVVRVGLQFVSVPQQKLAADWIDQELNFFLQPSQLKPELSTLQSIIVLVSGLYDSPLQVKFTGLFSYATSLVSLLGLHLPSPQHTASDALEKQLVLTVLEYLNTLGVSNFTASFELPTAHLFSLRLFKTVHTKFWCDQTFSTYSDFYSQYFAFLETYFFDHKKATLDSKLPEPELLDNVMATDLGVLISSICLYNFIRIYKEVRCQILHSSHHDQLEVLLQADKKLQTVFVNGFIHLHTAKVTYSVNKFQLNGEPIDDKTNLFSLHNCPNLNSVLAQFQLISAIRYHFIRLLIIDLLPKTSPQPSIIAFQAHLSASKLIHLINYVEPGPFNFYPTQLLATALRHTKPVLSTSLKVTSEDVDPALQLTDIPSQVLDMVDQLFGRVTTYYSTTTRAVITRLASSETRD